VTQTSPGESHVGNGGARSAGADLAFTDAGLTWNEAAFFFRHQDTRMFGFLHEPSPRAPRSRGHGLVFCPALAEEAGLTQRVCVDFARFLSERGYHVLRFDHRGNGDSEGDFEDATPDTWIADIRRAIAVLRERASVRVGLLGLRVGATLAALAAAEEPDVEPLILWEPVVELREYLAKFLRMQVMMDNVSAGKVVTTQDQLSDDIRQGRSVDVMGYRLSPRCVRELHDIELVESIGGTRAPTLLVTISRRSRRRKDIDALLHTRQQRGRTVEYLQISEQPFWLSPADGWQELRAWRGHDELFRRTADWLDTCSDDHG
jgi:exosortase A-associated hydrolase 2